MFAFKLQGNGEGTERLLKVKVIDETVLIETNFASKVGNRSPKKKRCPVIPKRPQENLLKEESDAKKDKWPPRKGKCSKRLLGNNGK